MATASDSKIRPWDRPRPKKEEKIMLPPPTPKPQYMLQAWGRATVLVPPAEWKLVVLDLNGTLLYRPGKGSKKLVNRPNIRRFLQYLFAEFEVMVWSSAQPGNVMRLTQKTFEGDMNKLAGIWNRDHFGLSTQDYYRNVQCYKDLSRVWSAYEIQRRIPGYEQGNRFDQRNTILIDDSALKAAAQPYNLVEIPEFAGVQNADGSLKEEVDDILGQVVGYLEVLKVQEDVSKFMHKKPFEADGTWSVEWERVLGPAAISEGMAQGSSTSKTTMG